MEFPNKHILVSNAAAGFETIFRHFKTNYYER
jgi:hypothetical protein